MDYGGTFFFFLVMSLVANADTFKQWFGAGSLWPRCQLDVPPLSSGIGQVSLGPKYSNQLFFIIINASLHDVHAWP